MNEAIKQILKTQGWKEVKEIFEDSILQEKKTIKTTNRRMEDIGFDYATQEKARRIVLNALNRIERAGQIKEENNISYE